MKNLKFFLVGLVFMLGISSCMKAGAEGLKPDVIGVHVGSYHVQKYDAVAGRAWNNANPGMYARWGNVVVGGYYNSIRQPSFYAGYVVPITDHFDLTLGAITGYSKGPFVANRGSYLWVSPGYAAKPVMPLVAPSFHFAVTDTIEARVHVLPKVYKAGATAIHFSLEFRL